MRALLSVGGEVRAIYDVEKFRAELHVVSLCVTKGVFLVDREIQINQLRPDERVPLDPQQATSSPRVDAAVGGVQLVRYS